MLADGPAELADGDRLGIALGQMLPVAAGHGIDPVLVTCDRDNIGSRRTIEANGGVLEDVRGVKMRFWVPTHPA